ncbi:hypothetical protein IW261DRAFT_1562552 [Armillaria novae-zelandiae]|uniref:BTB domain-containing protein n=1 Tax=Armillaria novae-zelandiae TaxID=153914 RepID=A0AA39UGB4_9AGAR|nr:hypothetical protein IW261DRAFT_1562552 [Armillaria novae-zelandiae]
MSWIIRDPPSPLVDNSLKLKDGLPTPEGNTLAPSPTPEVDPSFDLSFRPPPPPPLRLDIVEEQWSTNPLQVKSIFSTAGTGIQPVTSPACGMGWCFNFLPDRPAESDSRRIMIRGGRRRPVERPKNTVRMLASLQSSPIGFQPGTFSIRASIRRGDLVLAVLANGQFSVLKGQCTISLGHCDIPLPLDELFIDVNVTIFLQSSPVEDPQKLSISMTKAIRATLDGNFPADIKFTLFSRKSRGAFVCNRRPIYASSAILKGHNSFLDSYMNGSRDSDDPAPSIVCQYPYDDDSDLESDFDEDLPSDIHEMSEITAREPQTDPPSRPLFSGNNTKLDAVQSMPPGSPSDKMLPVASIPDVASDSSTFCVVPCEDSPAEGLGSPPRSGMSNSICMPEYDKAELPVYDAQADESTGRSGKVVDTVNLPKKVLAPPLHLALINDVAFRTFRALMVYMYTKEVAFIPLKSNGGRSYDVGDACSPKSMYRLAVKASHEGLKKHAFDNLRSQLTPQNIITEIFSKFTADYPEIFEMEVTVLLDHFTNARVRDEWERMIDTVVSGHLPRGADVLKKVTLALRT